METCNTSHSSSKGQEKSLISEGKLYRLNLPFKKPNFDELRSSRLQFQKYLPHSLEKKISEFSSSHDISISNILLGAFQTLLFRYSRQHDFVIGLKKNKAINPIRMEFHDKDCFLNLVSRLETTLNKKIHPSTSEQCQVIFSFTEEGLSEVNKNLVDLVFYIEEESDTRSIHIAAARKVFQLETVENMIGHYCQLLENALEHPQRELDNINYLTDEETHLLTSEFSSGIHETYPDDIVQHFENQVKENPNDIAVNYQGASLTYAELDRKANQIACYLHNHGVSKGTTIAVCSHYDPKIISCILAIIKLGATYLPLDPSYPETQLNTMLDDARPAILLTYSTFSEKFKHFSKPIAFLDQDWEKIQKESAKSLSAKPNTSDPAYIIYTSGSTGMPKGIMISYQSLPHLCLERRRYYPSKTIALLLGSISFDVSVLTVFHTLMTGGMLSIPEQSEKIDGEALIKNIEENQINFFICVPSFYAMLLDKSIPFSSSLEIVSLAGEAIPNSLPLLHAKLAPHAKLINEYGPSEVALGSTFAQIYDPLTKSISPIHVGKPLPNTEVYVLDPNLQLVPIGMKGEIYLGGMGLAKGYLNKEELTAEKFINVAIPGKPITRLYRTGDYGRILPDGNLEFLGRMDYQVKVRGHRIELGEVEFVLCQHEEIDEAVVKVQKVKDHQDRLVAYFTTTGKKILSVKELRQFVGERLPQFEVPSFFMQLKEFPRTPNHKIDRKALPIFPISQGEEVQITPQAHVKQTLLEIWKKVLNLKEIGLNDNFFDLGGNSLLLANIQTTVKDILKINVPIIEYFRYSTINSFAKYLESLKNQNLGSVRFS